AVPTYLFKAQLKTVLPGPLFANVRTEISSTISCTRGRLGHSGRPLSFPQSKPRPNPRKKSRGRAAHVSVWLTCCNRSLLPWRAVRRTPEMRMASLDFDGVIGTRLRMIDRVDA